jgi:hypothetical protein
MKTEVYKSKAAKKKHESAESPKVKKEELKMAKDLINNKVKKSTPAKAAPLNRKNKTSKGSPSKPKKCM